MNQTTIVLLVVGVIFLVAVFAVVMSVGTRLTGKQIHDDPDVRKHVDDDHKDDDFPVDAEF